MKRLIASSLLLIILFYAAASSDDNILKIDATLQSAIEEERALQRQQYQWVDLTDDELKGWYTPTDLCALENENKMKFPQDYRKDNCTIYSRGSRRMHCGVGMGANSYPCYPPFGIARPTFKRGIKGFTDYTSKPLLTAIEKFIATNTTLILLGDSTMRQKLQALECQVLKEDSSIRTNGNLWGILPCESKLTLYFRDGRQYQILAVSVGPNSANCLKGTTGAAAAFLQRQEQLSGGDNVAKARKTFENAQYIVEQENHENKRSVFILANMGLWYNEEKYYLEVMPLLLEWLSSVASVYDQRYSNTIGQSQSAAETTTTVERIGDVVKTVTTTVTTTITKLNAESNIEKSRNSASVEGVMNGLRNKVAWHETLMQHWKNTDSTGYFFKPTVDDQEAKWKDVHLLDNSEYVVPNCCQAATNISFMADWRNDIANALIRSNEQWRKNIRIFPMAEISRPASDLHTCAPLFRHDCTHYCFTPLMYQPLWHQLSSFAVN